MKFLLLWTRSLLVSVIRSAVQQRFDQLTSTHIEKVMDGIRENTTRVRNARAYLLAALFNAPSTTDNHYTMQVNHDLYSG